MRHLAVLWNDRSAWLCWVLPLVLLAPSAQATDPLVERARTFVAPAVESGAVTGMAVGLVRPAPGTSPQRTAETFTFGMGHARNDDAAPCDAQTIFEIGSISKVFTSLLLAEMAVRGEVQLHDPVGNHLPKDVAVPSRDGKEITLEQLSTHSSGLPRMPNNLKPKDILNPYAEYDSQRLYAFLNQYRMRHTPGERSVYSNLGTGLLGHALSRAAGKEFEELLRERIFVPLGMEQTSITLSDAQRRQLATGHDADGDRQPNWDLNVLAGAGGIRSDVTDMLKFLAAELQYTDTPLRQAMLATQAEHFRNPKSTSALGLAWQISPPGTIWHNGQTGGYHAYLGFRPAEGVGVVVLTNTATEVVDSIGRGLLHIVAGKEPPPLKLERPVDLTEQQLESLVGRYDLMGAVLSITREGPQLWAQLTLQSKARIYPRSENDFFYRLVDAQITFEREPTGRAARLVLHQNGQHLKATRIE